MRIGRLGSVLAVFLLLALVTAGYVISLVWRGFSARDQPSVAEKIVARSVRRMSVPVRARDAKNPVPVTPEVLADARAHFADHCASCHANDGSGNSIVGRNLYPKAPDMRLADTQQLSDGELYYIIQNGIRLTGMPAWGKEGDENDLDSWKIVHFIRHLHELTHEQIKEMEALNPKSPEDLKEEKEEEEFLSGETVEPDQPVEASPHQHN